MEQAFKKNKFGSYRLVLDERTVTVVFEDVINENLAEHYLQSLKALTPQLQGQPWAYLSNAQQHQAFTPPVIAIIEQAIRICVDNGCIVDAYVVDSPLGIKLLKESRQRAGVVSDINERIFDNEANARAFLQNTLAQSA